MRESISIGPKKEPKFSLKGCIGSLLLVFLVVYGFNQMLCSDHKETDKEVAIKPFTILQSDQTDGEDVYRLEIPDRYNIEELKSIIFKIRNEHDRSKRLAIHFLLPGSIVGVTSDYANCFYPNEENAKKIMQFKDANDEPYDLKIYGMNRNKADSLLSINPSDPESKNIIGKFIDVYTVKIVYTDTSKTNPQIYLEEYVEGPKLVFSANSIPVKTSNGIMFQAGELKSIYRISNNILTRSPQEEPQKIISSIKSGTTLLLRAFCFWVEYGALHLPLYLPPFAL